MGQQPPNHAPQLPATSHMGVIELEVANLELQTTYYSDALGLTILDETDTATTLGYNEPFIHLTTSESDHTTSTPTEAGLYHSAILYPNEAALAATILQLATIAPGTFQGSADHAVRLAFYFVDTEGNGLELYVDTPEDTWVWENPVGLGSLSVHVEGDAALQELQERLDAADVGYESTDEGISVQDPWGNTVRIIAQ